MASIEFDDLNDGAEYNTFRFGVMKAVWGAQKNPYLDIHKVASIGTHLLLNNGDSDNEFNDFQTIAKQVLENRYTASLGRQLWDVVDDETYSTAGALRNALDGVLADNSVNGHFSFGD